MKTSFDPAKNRGLCFGPLHAHAGAYLALLEQRGYKRPTIYPDTLLIADLDAWMKRHGQKVGDLREAVVERFLEYHMRERKVRLQAKRATLSRLLTMLREMGVTAPATERARTPTERWADEFGQYLARECGFAATTIAGYGS